MRLSYLIDERHARQTRRQHEAWARDPLIFSTSAVAQRRGQLRVEMLETGASPAEVDGVLKTFDETLINKTGFRPYGDLAQRPCYFWPLYAGKGSIEGVENQSAWVIECGWESLAILRGPSDAYPGHEWRLVIDGAPPHRVLDSQNCN